MPNLINTPTFIQKHINSVNIQSLVFKKVFDDLTQSEEMEELKEEIRFNEEFHKKHKKFNFYSSTGCGCDYCMALYAGAVVELHRLEKSRDRYYDCNLRDSLHIMKNIEIVRKQKNKYKAIKEELKKKIFSSREYH